MEIEAAGGVLDLIGKYGVTLVGLVIIAIALWKLIKRILDQYDAEKKSYLTRMQELTNNFDEKESKFMDTLNQFQNTLIQTNKLQTELAETNRLLVDKIEQDIQSIGGDIKLLLEKIEHK